MSSDCLLSLDEVRSTFLAAPPAILKEIRDLTLRTPSFMRDVPAVQTWETGNGTTQTELIFKGELPPTERDFSKWSKQHANTGCAPAQGPGCGYNITKLGGFGFDQKIIELMNRELVSEVFCIKDIQTTAHFKMVFAKLVENLFKQVDYMKEININFNFLTQLLKKYVVTSAGPKFNSANPYVYRNIGTGASQARLSSLNPLILEWFYEWMKKMPDVEPYDVVNGSPVYALIAGSQVLSHMYRDDPQARQDIRFSGYANDLITKYNFVNTIQGMFFPVTWMWPRRFNINSAGDPVEVLPTVQGIPMNYGTYTGMNPDYENATHEEVILCGKAPFKIWNMPTETSLGENTSFGPEPTFFEYWKFINPETPLDPLRREGYFITSATIGLSALHSEGMFGILVERPKVTAIATFLPGQSCPPTQTTCSNDVPAVACPCPIILSFTQNPVSPTHYFIQLSGTTTANPSDTVQFGLDTGGYIAGVVSSVSADKTALDVTFSVTPPSTVNSFTSIFCDNTLGCSASVEQYLVTCADNTQLSLILSNPIKAVTAAQVVTLYYGNGTSVSATVVSANMVNNTWVVDIGSTAFCDQVGGVISVCVPSSTDATCPACGTGVVITQCS